MRIDAGAVLRDLGDLIVDMRSMPEAEAEAHALSNNAIEMLSMLPASDDRDEYGHALVDVAPGLAADVQRVCAGFGTGTGALFWKSFPTTALGMRVGRYVTLVAKEIGCDESMVALPVLATLAGSIGNRVAVRLKGGWIEPCVLWCVVVARSGTRKSPAADEVTRHLRRVEHDVIEADRQARLDFEAALVAWKAAPRDLRGDRPVAPDPLGRSLVSDVTIEALAEKLANSPAGLLLYRDELAAWMRSFNRYRGGRGDDAAQWLELHRAGSIIVDRKVGGTISVPRAAVSIVGTIQPGVLASVLAGEHMENGLVARILYAMPPERPAGWSDDEVSPLVRENWTSLLDDLRALPVSSEPAVVGLTPAARAEFKKWFHELALRRAESESDVEAAIAAKIEGAAARLALVRQLVDDPGAPAVDVEAMVAGIEMARWFHDEALRVLASFTESPQDHERRKLVEWINGKGGAVTARDLRAGVHRYRPAGAAQAALDGLVGAGLGRWVTEQPGPQGGRPKRVFRLHDDGHGTETLLPVPVLKPVTEPADVNAGAPSGGSSPVSEHGEEVSVPGPDEEEMEI